MYILLSIRVFKPRMVAFMSIGQYCLQLGMTPATVIFPDHSVTELESFVQRLYCQAPRPSTPFMTVPITPPEMFVTGPETPVQHHPIPSPKKIEARLLLLCEERSVQVMIEMEWCL